MFLHRTSKLLEPVLLPRILREELVVIRISPVLKRIAPSTLSVREIKGLIALFLYT